MRVRLWGMVATCVVLLSLGIYSRRPADHDLSEVRKLPLRQASPPGSAEEEPDFRSRRPSPLEIELRQKWKSLRAKSGSDALTREEKDRQKRELARECVERLGIGPGLVLLMLRVYDDHDEAPSLIEDAVNDLLRQDSAGIYRGQLVDFLNTRDFTKNQFFTNNIAHYLSSAGAGISAEQLNDFLAKVESAVPEKTFSNNDASYGQTYRQDALLGFCAEHVKQSPLEAISMIRDQLSAGISSTYSQPALFAMAKALPPDSDFAALESAALLGVSEKIKPGSGMEEFHEQMISKWGESAPADAANFVMEHVDVLGLNVLQTVVGKVALNDPLSGANWAQTFPEGEFRDAALAYAVAYLSGFPDKAMELANQIRNPDQKTEAMNRANLFIEARKNREGRGR